MWCVDSFIHPFIHSFIQSFSFVSTTLCPCYDTVDWLETREQYSAFRIDIYRDYKLLPRTISESFLVFDCFEQSKSYNDTACGFLTTRQLDLQNNFWTWFRIVLFVTPVTPPFRSTCISISPLELVSIFGHLPLRPVCLSLTLSLSLHCWYFFFLALTLSPCSSPSSIFLNYKIIQGL